MKRYIKGVLLVSFVIFISFSLIKYTQEKESNIDKKLYFRQDETILMGGMASDKKEIDSFADSLKEKEFRKYWDALHLSAEYEKKCNYIHAIQLRQKALEVAHTKGDIFQVWWGLARLYEKNKQYKEAISILNRIKEVNDREDVLKETEEWKIKLTKLLSELQT